MGFQKKVLIAGAGKSGVCAARLLQKKGAEIVLYDGKKDTDVDKLLGQLETRDNVKVILGELNDNMFSDIDIMIISPGISIESHIAEEAGKRDIPIWGEVELAYQMGAGHVAAITGTNGKTTTTSLVGEIFKAYTENSYTVGNIGIPYTDVAAELTDDSYVALEVSSFQLETIEEFHPHVSAVLNVTPDHLDRHHTMENYASVKLDVCINQSEEDYLVLNYDDPITREMAEDSRVKAKVIYFSRTGEPSEGVYQKGDAIFLKTKGEEKKVIDISELVLLGAHNVENYMAGIAVTYYMGIPVDVIVKVLKTFKGVAHRIEFVDEIAGVAYYNDSKGTNPDAAIKGIQAMNRRTVLIGGGYDKGVPFDDWIKAFDGKVKKLVLLGQTRDIIADTARRNGFDDIIFVESLEEAVNVCALEAEPGDAVLLSPACASWGMFDNYEQRGDMFKDYVRRLK
ncbi:MAG: UDP-N-acetylmuramoyl-L-alanine--D-glutamate ligase [Lachnospiraceae bacterium]|nr:UDP-N-acetylmuramoyl-L-alanine--D-glutamate ligase [Lachnospiraceae bacterium]